MTRRRLLEQLTDLVRRERGDPGLQLSDSDELVADLGLESSEIVWVVCELERSWGVTFPEEDLSGLATVGGLLDLAERLTTPGSGV